MKLLDYAKAAGVAFILLAINVLIVILVVMVYALFIEPGHPSEFYDEAAKWLAPWCLHTAGTALFFVAGWFLTTRQPERNAYQMVMIVTLFYLFIDAASVGFAGIWSVGFALSMLAKLLASLAGAFAGSRFRSKPAHPR
ncbi:hypothetical protein [Gimesia alba]|nr:hypothetical protein [Gimesia alba]